MPEEKANSSKKHEIVPVKPKQKPAPTLVPYRPNEFWEEFDRSLDRLRRDFEDVFWPSQRFLERRLPLMPQIETRMPKVDLQDRGKDFLLTAEIPGFKKDEIEVHVQDDAVEIRGKKSSKSDEKREGYIRKERSSESFYRNVKLPELVKNESAEANLKDGVLELVLAKKAPKSKKKVNIK